jgi:autotransporter translocation and assembly factor TamB
MRRAALWFGVGSLGLVVALVLVVVFLVQAAPGHRFLLRTAINVVERQIDGTLQVQEIRSAGLLRGFMLDGVTVRDREGRPFLEADGVRIGYSVRGLVARDVVLEPVEVIGLRVTIETLPGDTLPNVARIFGSREEAAEPRDAPALRLALRRVSIRGGSFVLRDAEGAETTLEGIEARFSRVVLLDPDEPGETFEVDQLSATLRIDGLGDGPIRIEEFRGTLRRVDTRIDAEVDLLRLTESRIDGRIALDWGPEPELHLDLEADPFDARDLAWLDPRIPEARGKFLLLAEGPPAEGRWYFDGVELTSGRDRIAGRFGFELGETLRLLDTDVEGELRLAILEPWLDEPLPVEGRVTGRVQLEGPLAALQVDGDVSFDDPDRGIPATRARITGRVNPEAGTVTGLSVRVDPLRLETLQALGLDYRGEGTLELEATGGLDRGIELSAVLVHSTAALDLSRVRAQGTVRRDGERFLLALDTSFDPLSLAGLERGAGIELPVDGDFSGALRLDGPLEALAIRGDVITAGGGVELDALLDVTDPARQYRVAGRTTGLDLTAFVTEAPEGSSVTGSFEVEGMGFDLATLSARVRAELEESRWGEWRVEAASVDAEAGQGRLELETFSLRSVAGEVEGHGDLALSIDAPEGTLVFDWRLEDLSALRPLVMGEGPMDPDTLSVLERELLLFDGIEVDPAGTVPLRGSASGSARIEGRLDDLRGSVELEAADVAWADFETTLAEVAGTFRVERRPEATEEEAPPFRITAMELRGGMTAPSWGRYAFEEIAFAGAGIPEALDVELDLRRQEGESYHTEGRVEFGPERVAYRADVLELLLDPVAWSLVRPAHIAWENRVLRISDLEVARPGNGEPVRILLDGFVDLDGALDLRAEAEGVDLDRLGGILQVEPRPTGMLALELTLGGTAERPEVDGWVELGNLVVGDVELTRVGGTLGYADERARIRVEVEQNGARLLTASGTYPVNLALGEVENRFPSREVDLLLEVDDLPAATAFAPLDALEEVQGRLDGRIEFRGAPDDLRPSGALRLRDGGFSLPEIGIAPAGIEALFELTPDGTVRVDAAGRSIGSVEVRGTVDLSELADPRFDLEVQALNFQAVNRRDMEGRVSGTILLGGRYTAPRVTGAIRVDQANLFLEEFARSAEVVDLSDPAFLAAVDTTLAAARPVLQAAQNPFLENLRVDADLSMPRDVWLRSRELNVEIGGDLIVTFDRRDREILLVGTVAAIRGNYNAFGRQFQVRTGSVDFVGTPGINPALDIEAVHRLRQQGGEPLEIVANLEGTLLSPRITLTSGAAVPISESDLISYLIFGRPSYALASAESRMLGDAAISAGIGAAAGQLSSLLGQQIGLDFFNITQAQESVGFGALSGQGLVDTQVELGQYLTDNVFLALVLRPLRGIGGSQAQIPGARVEWRFTDLWTLNAYLEDRFGREGVYTFGEMGLRVNRIFGLELYREWGY